MSATPSSRESAAGAVLVTGASTGIGAACALGLDRLGMRVFAGVRRATDGAALQRQASPLLTAVAIDVTDVNSIAGAARTITAVMGDAGLAGLVNNAGIVVPGPLEFLPLADLRRQLEINVVGQIAVTQAMLPLLRAARGRIVNMGSIGGRMATPFVGAYAASKFALEALTDALRVEVRPWRIGVSIIEPGAIATPIWQKSAREGERLREAMPAEAMRLYGQALEALRKGVARAGAGRHRPRGGGGGSGARPHRAPAAHALRDRPSGQAAGGHRPLGAGPGARSTAHARAAPAR